jgi:hypothetical protein
MYRLLFASDLVINSELGPNNFWNAISNNQNKMKSLRDFTSKIGSYDGLVVNIEAPIMSGHFSQASVKNGPHLKQDKSVIDTLMHLKVSVALLANNHIGDFGVPGIASTIKALEDQGISAIGAGAEASRARRAHVVDLPEECGRRKIVIANYAEEEFGSLNQLNSYGYNPICYKQALLDAKNHQLNSTETYSVAVVHGGAEFCNVPPPSLRTYAQFLIEIGFDLVLCQHTHVVGCIEKYSGGTIVYGQGNFIFPLAREQANIKDWRTGLVVGLSVKETEERLEFFKTEFSDTGLEITSETALDIDDLSGLVKTLDNEQDYLRSWCGWCEENYPRYANIFFGYGFLRRVLNKLLKPSYGDAINARLKSINYIRTESHRDVIKTLANMAIESDNQRQSK